MSTPQQTLKSFLEDKAAAYGEAKLRLVPVYSKYFGQPLSQHASAFLPRDNADEIFEDVRQSGGSATIITREHFPSADVRTRYHLAAEGECWKIIRIDRECFLCSGKGKVEGVMCQKCDGEGWYNPR
jgi:hypothetical protein